MIGEKDLSVHDAVATYKELTDVESGFRQLKDVMGMRPIFHQVEHRVKAHIFVAALAWMPTGKKSLTEPPCSSTVFRLWRGIAAGCLVYLCTDSHRDSSLIQLR